VEKRGGLCTSTCMRAYPYPVAGARVAPVRPRGVEEWVSVGALGLMGDKEGKALIDGLMG
jgi:hypothetical protein